MRHTLSLLLFGASALTFTACNGGPAVSTATQETKPVSVAPAPELSPPSPWHVSQEANPLNGELTITATNSLSEHQYMVIRKRGKKLELYVDTYQFLETLDTMDTGVSTVKYKFDDGPIVTQGWHLSSNNMGLFYPGSPQELIAKMQHAKKFVFQYKPADYVAETLTFDVTQFPVEFVQTAHSKTVTKAEPCASWEDTHCWQRVNDAALAKRNAAIDAEKALKQSSKDSQ